MTEITFEGGSDQVDEGTIQAWFLEEGDPVKEGDDLAEISTSEGVVVVQAPCSGILTEVYFDEGETVARNEVLCLIDDDESRCAEPADDEEEDGKKEGEAW